MPDHVHLFISAPPMVSPTRVVQTLKSVSAREIFEMHPYLRQRMWKGKIWSKSYYVGTAGAVSAEIIKRYIENQKHT